MTKFNKILILGNGGAGKSTLAKRLSELLSFPVLHLDKIYWVNQWQKNDPECFDQSVNHFMQQEKWIIEGTPMRGIENRIKAADLIIFITLGRIRCIFQILKRRFSKKTFDNTGCPAIKLNLKTFLWIWNFNKKAYPYISAELNTTKKEVIYIKNNRDISLLLKNMANQV